ncbi:glycoside hydrolase family 55 protein [Aspergillus alliaceus]|uniref:glycoside hydrolase family 55 protein n=1 Tax=Petromyces alliaceus TaxID=209559 RepID=UPI0012A40EF8|nr:pectate lyase superfamily protein-domain-containing protein [Aspergillus alliaceus]KAB8227284.1 pectate lyase superfamily protein-domain-containing protein [Aspergillus alliaceus]
MPSTCSPSLTPGDTPYWLANIAHQGIAAFNTNRSTYQVFRNVKDFGARGDGVADDTAAINRAIRDGGRFGPAGRRSSTTTPALVYFPAGTYVISSPIVDYYFTQLVGNPNALPIIKASPLFPATWLIDGDQYQSDGNQGWVSTNVFFRQIRNLVLDMTDIPADVAATGIHWPTGQATSIQNVHIMMNSDSGTEHQGLLVENGSGGFITDVAITGGKYGANFGSQQFTIRNLTVSNARVGVWQAWNWGWIYQGINIANCTTAVDMTNGGQDSQQVGSITIIDSTIRDCAVFVDTVWRESVWSNGSLTIENVNLSNVPIAINGSSGTVLAGSIYNMTINAWGQGHQYTPSGLASFKGSLTPVARPPALRAHGSSHYYTKTKPQYESNPVASFVSIRSAGAVGDGTVDDTAAIQAALLSAAASRKIIFFDQGVYRVTDTIYIPPNSRIVGEAFPVIMGSGSKFATKDRAIPIIQVGRDGESGYIEWSDMMVSTQGSTPGAVLVEWNLRAARGSGMWDVHSRIGGFTGSELQVTQCPTSAAPSEGCEAAFTAVHVTGSAANVYLENVWIWTADHDLDDPSDTQISIYTGRGLLIEGRNIWLYGTSVEHHSLYQYYFSAAQNVVAGFIQTETPYWQPSPDAFSGPFPSNRALQDPEFHDCQPGSCNALGLFIRDSHNVSIYGAGLYSFFSNYSTTCSEASASEKCQSEIFRVDGHTTSTVIHGLSTIGTANMIVQDGEAVVRYDDNRAGIESIVAYLNTGAH